MVLAMANTDEAKDVDDDAAETDDEAEVEDEDAEDEDEAEMSPLPSLLLPVKGEFFLPALLVGGGGRSGFLDSTQRHL